MKKMSLVKSGDSTTESQSQLCYACNSSRVRVSYNNSVWRVLHCLDCGLYFVSAIPTAEELASNPSGALYEETEKRDQLQKQSVRANCTSNEIIKLQRHGILHGKRILDFVCGYGFFLKLLNEGGWEVYGCEQNAVAREYAYKMGLGIYQDLKCQMPGHGLPKPYLNC
jgi:2-polyprenyl-3-methyl-5-hydroxy-6-metoxy-1,4-benzoquinol methylase